MVAAAVAEVAAAADGGAKGDMAATDDVAGRDLEDTGGVTGRDLEDMLDAMTLCLGPGTAPTVDALHFIAV